MTPSRKELIEELFANATELPEAERGAYLDEQCGNDPALRAEVEQLVSHFEKADGKLMAKPAFEFTARLNDSQADPVSVGSYKILHTIGVGGMGVVYEAEQENPHRTVAIKVIRPGLATNSLLSRFRHEAEVLALLQHPGIAHIYEAGVAPAEFGDGTTAQRPFFAMEFIRGKMLTDFADQNNLGTRDRLGLMTRICDAVHHAHQKGVIHRDLKPHNILVDEEAQSKILDFGVARAIDADVQTATMQTDVGQLVGTVAYMSPEQVQGDSSRIDTRSDVYTLGVILYELLSGQLPYAVRACAIPEVARIIREENPTRLSSFNPAFRGDLDTIVQKALEKEKERRYQSAAELALDIGRYLNDEPIIARPQSKFYQIRKFAKRNVGLVAGIAVAFCALAVGMILAVSQAINAHREAARAESETRRAIDALAEAEAITTFLTDMLATANPYNIDKDVRVLDVLETASARVGEEWTDFPLVEARLRQAIGRTYYSLGKINEAEQHLGRAFEIQKKRLGMESDITLVTAKALAIAYSDQSRFDESETLHKEILALQRGLLGNDHPSTLKRIRSSNSILPHQHP